MKKKSSNFIIYGGKELRGTIVNQVCKNAVLPIMSATLLAKGKTVLCSYPKISDVYNMKGILEKLGAKVEETENQLEIDTFKVNSSKVDCKLSKTMRSSIFLLGSLLARFKTACVTLPGGCDIGQRPIDIHIRSFKELGVKVSCIENKINFDAHKAKANKVKLKLPSVGATENLVQFCSVLPGKSVIFNAAREPEVVDLCNFLNKMGAKIYGAGTSVITIYGVNRLNSTTYNPMKDRIFAGTIMLAVAMVGGDVTIVNACAHENEKIIEKLCSMGCQINIKNDILRIVKVKNLTAPKTIKTRFYPYFPTDLQSQMLSACCVAEGETKIIETIFENRFLVVEELKKMGASISKIKSKVVSVKGIKRLKGAEVYAKDLRGGASLVLAGLAAEGKTVVHNVNFIDRGYEHFENVLTQLGADIKRE